MAALHSQGLCCGTRHNGLVSPVDLSAHILCHIKSHFFVFCAGAHHRSLRDCSSRLRCLELSLITRRFGWTCRRQESSFRETPCYMRAPVYLLIGTKRWWGFFLAPLNKSGRLNGWFVSLGHQCISTLGIFPRTFIKFPKMLRGKMWPSRWMPLGHILFTFLYFLSLIDRGTLKSEKVPVDKNC